jgi:hypothetical protein
MGFSFGEIVYVMKDIARTEVNKHISSFIAEIFLKSTTIIVGYESIRATKL